jgi:hypothetical protein
LATLHPLFYPYPQIPDYPPQLIPPFARQSCNPFLLKRVKVSVIQLSRLIDGCDWTQSGSRCRSPKNKLAQPPRLSFTHTLYKQPIDAETLRIATCKTLPKQATHYKQPCVISSAYGRVERPSSSQSNKRKIRVCSGDTK